MPQQLLYIGEIALCRNMVNGFIEVVEATDFLLIVRMAWHRAKSIILCDGRYVVSAVVLADCAKAPRYAASGGRSISQRLLYYLI